MIKKISLRWRLTLLSSLLIAICCIGLSVVLNLSAYRMADSIDAIPMQPAQSLNKTNDVLSMTPSAPSETVKQAKNNYLTESVIYTICAVFLGGVLTYYVSGKALNPVRALNEQVKNINTHNLDESLPIPSTNDELAELTSSFNDMTDKLAQAFDMQKRFSADAAHELRTPLTVLQTKLDVFLKREQHSAEEYEALISTFQKQIRRMRSLVTELLEIANMEHEMQKQDVSLDSLLDDVVNDLIPVATEKHISLNLENGGLYVSGDYELLYRAFYNLCENAIKYNKENGKVFVSMLEAGKNIIVTVTDTGIGISNDMKKQIFEPFYRVDKSRSREMGGAGLGLALVDKIIKKHSGTIKLTDDENGGSCFTVTLPKE